MEDIQMKVDRYTLKQDYKVINNFQEVHEFNKVYLKSLFLQKAPTMYFNQKKNVFDNLIEISFDFASFASKNRKAIQFVDKFYYQRMASFYR